MHKFYYFALLLTGLLCSACNESESASKESSVSQQASPSFQVPKELLSGECLHLEDSAPGYSYSVLVPSGKAAQLQYFRTKDRVAIVREHEQMVDTWFNGDRGVNFRRWFLKDKRRIDYEAGDLKTLGSYAPLSEQGKLVVPGVVKHLGEPQKVKFRCLDASARTARLGSTSAIVVELKSGVLAAYVRTSAGRREEMKLTGSLSQTQLDQLLAKEKELKPTDFADVGDNESDPFLAKAIRQGFVVLPGHSASHDHEEKPGQSAAHSEHSH